MKILIPHRPPLEKGGVRGFENISVEFLIWKIGMPARWQAGVWDL